MIGFFSSQNRCWITWTITFLWCPLPMLPSKWLSFCPFGTMYILNIQCNACKFYSLFVWLFIFSNPKPAPNLLQYQKKSPKLHFEMFIVQLNSFGNLNITQIIIQSSQLIHFKYISHKRRSCSPFSNQKVQSRCNGFTSDYRS